jgi:hypothetical protein
MELEQTIIIRYADAQTQTFERITFVGATEQGLLALVRGNRKVAEFPLMHVSAILYPDSDNVILPAKGLIVDSVRI